MKNVAVLHDALRGETFGFVVKSAGSFEFHGVDASSSQWASWVNSTTVKSLHSIDMPPGVIVGAFKQMSDDEFQKITDGGTSVARVAIATRKNAQYIATIREKNASRVPGVFDTPINHFKNEQFLNVINYKGLAFRVDAKKSSLLREVKANNYAFDPETAKFSIHPSIDQKELVRERIESNTTSSFERRLGIKSLKFQEHDGSRTAIGNANSLETKALGGRIGGGGGVARRARRGAAGFARFDPKAWDGDGDGLVQEGTPYQRPAIPGVNDRASRGNVDVAAVQRTLSPAMRSRTQGGTTRGRQAIKPPPNAPTARTSPTKPIKGVREATRRTAADRATDRANTAALRARRERAVNESGMRSRVKDKTRGKAGIDRVSELDGTAWAAMSDEQKKTVQDNLQNRVKFLQDNFKDIWDAYLRNPKNVRMHPGINRDSDFTSDFMVSLQAEIQDAERDAKAAIRMDDPNREEKLAKIDKKFQGHYRMFDDLKTIRAMQARNNYEMLEHLHPASKAAALGRNQKNPGYSKVDGSFPSMNRTVESTYFGRSGKEKSYVTDTVLETGEKAKLKKRTSQKLGDLSRRLLDPNPQRAARRARRKARKAGTARQAGEAQEVRPGIARRIRRARRTISAKLRGQETAADILKRANKNKASSSHPLEIKDGKSVDDVKLKITDKWIAALAFVADEVDRVKKGEKGKNERSERVRDVALLNVWENMGHNALPTLVTEEQWNMLVAQGWTPMSRGVGDSTGFVDAYLEDEDRFIPGQGGRVHGVGEYWAPDGSSHAWGYGKAQMLAVVSPDARVIKERDLEKITNEGRQINQAIQAFNAGMPGDEAFNMDPKDYVDALMDQLKDSMPKDSALWNSQIGQIYSQLLEAYSKTGGDPDKKREVWTAMQYLKDMFRFDYKYFAPVLGYDVIQGSGVTLIHNRGAVVAVDRAYDIPTARETFQKAKAAA